MKDIFTPHATQATVDMSTKHTRYGYVRGDI